ncbi:hypothetical protein [Nostoc sp.]
MLVALISDRTNTPLNGYVIEDLKQAIIREIAVLPSKRESGSSYKKL